MAYCAKCFHRDVCQTCQSCDGRVPKCRQFIDREAMGKEIEDARVMINQLKEKLKAATRTGRWTAWRPPHNMVLCGVTKMFVCSECSAKFVQTFRYCPHCGTQMEQEGPTWTVYE